jgi:hypothetical protein
MKKNVASQVIGTQIITASDGSAFSGSVSVYITKDGGSQTIGSIGSGAATSKGNGYYEYSPAQAETNANFIAFTFIGTGAIASTICGYTDFPQTADVAAGVTVSTLPAIPNNWITTAGITDGALTAAKFANDTTVKAQLTGTAVGAGATTITLDGNAVGVANYYDGSTIQIISGTGAGQARVITGYTLGKVATLSDGWATQPVAGSVYTIHPLGDVEVSVNNDKTGYGLSGMQTFNNTGTWTGNITGSVGSVTGAVGGSVASVVAGVTLAPSQHVIVDSGSVTVSDKTGFSLSQSFPANFSSLGISLAGKINGVVLTDTATMLTNAPTVPSAVAIRQEIDTNSMQLANIKAKTDNLPLTPAGTGDPMILTGAYDAAKSAASAASVAAIPTSPLLAANYIAPDNAGITAIQSTLTAIEGAGFDGLTDSLQQIRDNLGSGGSIDAAGIRSAIGLATANLDTQLAALPAEIETAVLDSLQADHQTLGTIGASIKAGGNAGDPWAATDADLALYPQSSAGWTIHRFNIGQPDAPLTVIPGLPPEDIVCRVYGMLKTPGNALAVGASVTFELIMQDPIHSNAIIVGRVVEATTDSSGRLSINGHPYVDLERNDKMIPATSHWTITSLQIGWDGCEFTLTDGLLDLASLIP